MPPGIRQDIGECVPHLAGRPQHVQVIALAQHRPASPERPVHGPRKARRHRLHSAPQGFPSLRLDDRVQVVALERELDQPKRTALRAGGEARHHLAHHVEPS